MNRRRVLTLTVSAMAMALASACGGGSGKAIKVVIAEYSKDHTRPFWQGLAEQYTKQTGVKVDLQVDRLELDRSAGQHDDPEQPAARRAQPQLVLELRQGRPALLGGRGPVAQDPGGFPRGLRAGRRPTGTSSTGSRSWPARAPSSTTATCSPSAGVAAPPRTWDELVPGRGAGAGARRRRDRLRAAARARGGAGRVVHLDVEQRRRLEVGRRLGDQQRQERRRRCQFLAALANTHKVTQVNPGQDQPHRRRLPALQGRQGRDGHGLQPARRPARRGGQGALRRDPDADQRRARR